MVLKSSPEKPHDKRDFLASIDRSIEQGISRLVKRQDEDGFWVGTLESNSCMEAEWILAQHILGITDDPKYLGVIQSILREQRDDGSWEVYYDATGGDINTTVECYTALRTAGYNPNEKPLRQARVWIEAHGGLLWIRNFTKYWLALLGEWPWEHVPVLPPEIILLPSWAPFSIYKFASWARGTILPLCVLSARHPTYPLPPERRLDELFPQGRDAFDYRLPRNDSWLSWEGFFTITNRLLQRYLHFPIKPFREHAIKICLEWILKHQEADGAWSGIQPPWIYSLMALHMEGYALSHPVIKAGLNAFNKHWKVEREGAIYLQASESPVWDTALATLALIDCNQVEPHREQIAKTVAWLLQEQVTTWGDWQVYVKGTSGGWAFEFENDAYPDVDDTAVVLIILHCLRSYADDAHIEKAIHRGTEWMLAMQNKNGGWAAFDRDNDSQLITKIPFADFGEILDPSSVDVTGHVLEALACQGKKIGDPIINTALGFIKEQQETDGSWFGRWGCNHIYGTAAVLPALRAIGENMSLPYVKKAANWVASCQNSDGGWGETCASYMDPAMRGVGKSTASQTSWALMALLAMTSNLYDYPVKSGIDYLLASQRQDGTWDEPEYTGTGFPGYSIGERMEIDAKRTKKLGQSTNLERAFMINYTMYRHYFPLIALGRARHIFANLR